MNAVVILSGGQGNQLVSASVACELVNKYDKIYVVCDYYWWGAMIEQLHSNKIKCVPKQFLPQLSVEIMRHTGDWDWLVNNVYQQGEFTLRKKHFIPTLRKIWNLPDAAISAPLVLVQPQMAQYAEQLTSTLGKFIVFCRKGGMPMSPDKKQQYPLKDETSEGLLREYPEMYSLELVQLLNKRGYKVLQCKLDAEPLIDGCVTLPQEVLMPIWAAICAKAEAVVTIDSCLMHVAAAQAKKMVVLWRETSKDSFGYEAKNIINLAPNDYSPIAPLFSGIPDTPICEPAKPQQIIEVLFNESKKNVNSEGNNISVANK